MKLLNRANFDLCFDIKNLPELQRKIQQYENPMHLLGLMYTEIKMLNEEIQKLKIKLSQKSPGRGISMGDCGDRE